MTDNNKPAQQPLPLRGVAMILIAVAVLLAGWGIYTAVSGLGGDSEQQAAPAAATSKSTAPAAQKQQPKTQPEQPMPQETPQDTPSAAPQDTPQQQPQQPQQPAGNQPITVHVLNNSTVQGLAARAGDRLDNAGYTIGHVGNYSDTVVPQNTVYFSDNEAQARELAAEIGGVAVPRPANLPAETQGPSSLVVVLATDF
ncbi:LytR cell envelope-related transcriptional attenuator [Corynebacterium mustelae]|uniref:LytR cell envelope-related transcriptional attenuator n=1 Tax=Corynebacterium mustelae TaxID=571915 RepID=A0A0G3H2K0_9CORY|nr:LytR C-terminal domain-containing protein [Corynebacterium mustelae]AKK06995.1 LytR cell envelope-related transcriptional attenuator [Corynebacterium mustelae]